MALDNDAREFGQHFKQGGWRLGLLVARNVEHGGAGGRPAENRSPENSSGKVSISRFAEMAGVSKSHVSYCYKAWQLAADDGKCPHAEALSPDDEVLDDIEEDDEDHTQELWAKYLQMAKEPQEPKATGTKAGSGSKSTKGGTADKVSQAVDALTKTSEQLSEKLVKVVSGVGPKLMGDDADLKAFVEQLRQTRFELDRQCREIDQLLERIGFADAEPEEPDTATESN
jgi:hypothetical protein